VVTTLHNWTLDSQLLHWTASTDCSANCFQDTSSAQATQKTQPLYCCVLVCFGRYLAKHAPSRYRYIVRATLLSRVMGVRVTDIAISRFDWLDLLGVSITISLDYNSSHILLPHCCLHLALAFSLLFFIFLCSSVVFCHLLANSLPEVGSDRTVWKSPPWRILILCLRSNCPFLLWLLWPSLLSNRSSIVDRVTRVFSVPYLNALSNPSLYSSIYI
jgi:hypothetical protein